MFTITSLLYFLSMVYSQTCEDKVEDNLIYTDVRPGEISFGVRILDTFLEFQPITLWACVKQCMRRKECLSFNFCVKINYCELNYVEKKNGKQDTSKTKNLFVHSDISSWNKMLNLIGNCTDHKCPDKYKCNTSGVCELSDCGQPPLTHVPNAIVIGQGDHRIGNGVFVGCKEPFIIKDDKGKILPGEILPVKCNANGAWEILSFSCEENMLIFDDHWYYFHTKAMNWHDAKKFCRSMDFNLVKIDNKKEDDWIFIEVQKRKYWFWTGGNDIAHEGKWMWEADNSIMTFTNWQINEPNNIKEEDCFFLSATLTGWIDYGCENSLRFICEQ